MRTAFCLAVVGVLAAGPVAAQGVGPQGTTQAEPTHLSPPLVARIQRELQSQGLYTGKIDGKFGPATRRAVEEFQSANHLQPTGNPDSATLVALSTQSESSKQPMNAGKQTPAQARAERLRAYQAREGAETRPGGTTRPGWASSAAPGQGAVSGLTPGSRTAANGSLTSVNGALAGAPSAAAPSAPRGFFGYSSDMSNGFNAATGRER